MTALQMRLGKGRIVIPAQYHIAESIGPHQFQQAFIGGVVLLPAAQPVLQILLRYQPLKEQGFLLLTGSEPFCFFLVLQSCVPEDICAISPIVVGLLIAGSLPAPWGAHDGAEDIELHIGVSGAKFPEPCHPGLNLCLREIMLP